MFRNAPKVKPSVTGGFRVLATLIGLVVLMSLIAVAFALRKLRDEHMNLRAVVVSGLDSTVQAEESRLAALQARLGALENQLSEQESSELAALVEGLPEAERQKFLTALPVEGPETRHAGLHGRISGTQQPPPVEPAPAPGAEAEEGVTKIYLWPSRYPGGANVSVSVVGGSGGPKRWGTQME